MAIQSFAKLTTTWVSIVIYHLTMLSSYPLILFIVIDQVVQFWYNLSEVHGKHYHRYRNVNAQSCLFTLSRR